MPRLRHYACRVANTALSAALGLALGGCGGGTSSVLSSGGGNTATYAVGGQLSGLPSGETLQLLNNNGDALTVNADGSFTFPTKLAAGSAYDITVGTQPAAANCSVSSGNGTVAGAVSNIAVTCSPVLVKHIALFLDHDTGTLLPYSYDLASGQLSALPAAPQGTGQTADAVLIDASATHAYTLGQASAVASTQISAFTIGAGGVVSANGLPLNLDAAGVSIALDSSGRYLYALQQPASGTSAITTFAVDPTSGRLGLQSSYRDPTSTSLASLWRNPASSTLYALDPGPAGSTAGSIATFSTGTTGNVNRAGVPIATGSAPVAMAMTSDGKYAYVISMADASVWIYTAATDGTLSPANPPTLALASIGSAMANATPESIAIDPTNRYVYVGDTTHGVIDQFSINPDTGGLTALPTPTIASPVSPDLLSVVGDSTTRSWLYIASRASADVATLSIDAATGQLAAMKPAAFGLQQGTAISDDAFSH